MRPSLRVCLVLAVLVANFGLEDHATAGLILIDRLSEVTFNGVNLGTGGEPGPDASRQTTDLTAPFSEILTGLSSAAEFGGAVNSGTWSVSQDTTILPGLITATLAQTASTSTDFGSPGIFTSNAFHLVFGVDSDTRLHLEGSILGSSNPASDQFARVELKQGAAPIFSTSFPSGTFPFDTILLPNQIYTLTVDVSGETLFNNSTTSGASIRLSIVPEPSTLTMLTLGLLATCAARRTVPPALSSQRR